MESQVVPQQHGHHTYENDPQNSAGLHSVVEGEDHHEKKSVLKKVKAKAKKLKDTITKHGHGHDHDHHEDQYNTPDDHDLEEGEDDEEDEDTVEDPEVHGAPIYESTAVMSGVSSEGPKTTEKDRYGLEGNQGKNRVNFGETTLMDDGIRTPVNTPQAMTPSAPKTTQQHPGPTGTLFYEQQGKENDQNQPAVNLASPVGLEKDAHAPDSEGHHVSNYQSKVTDPTGSDMMNILSGKEINVAPVSSSLGKMNLNDITEPNWNIPTETRPAASCLPSGSHDQFSPESTPMETEASHPDVEKLPGQGGYAKRISTAAAAVAEKAMAAKDLVASKLGYGDQDQAHHKQQEGNLGDSRAEQTGYTEKISSAATTIAEKATSAKDVVASKIGYGKKDETPIPEMNTGMETAKPASPTASPTGPKKGIVDTVTEKLTPMYAKVAGTSGIVTSKARTSSSSDEMKQGPSVQQDKGMSVKDYLGEKLKPGEEDKVLSEMISSALHKKNEGEEEKGKVLGKVTESKEVKEQLGDEKERNMNDGLTEGVVEKLRGTVGSWFDKSEATSHAPESYDDQNVAKEEHSGERRLQESTY